MATSEKQDNKEETATFELEDGDHGEPSEQKPQAPDGGWGWLCIVGRFYIHFLIFGTKSAFGIIYIELIEYYDTNRANTAWVGSLASGLILLSAPLTGWMTEKYGCRTTTIVGSLVAATGFFISWFSFNMLFLCLTYGILTGIGMGLTFIPSAVIVLQYFDKKRGLASSLGSSGGGLGSMLLPLLYTKMFEVYGWRGTLLILSALTLNGVVCGALFRPPSYLQRLKKIEAKPDASEKPSGKEMLSVLKNIRFVLFVFGTLFFNMGLVVPIVHLPDMAKQRGVSKNNVALLLFIMGISGVLLRIPIGWVSDMRQVNRTLIHALGMVIGGVATLICPFLYTFETLVAYSVLEGGLMGVYSAFLSVLVADIVGLADTNKGFAFLVFFSGLPSLVSSPLAGYMYDRTGDYFASFIFSGTMFTIAGVLNLIVFVLGRRKTKKQIRQ